MNPEPPTDPVAERLVRWAAQCPLTTEEAEQRYAHLLAGLPSIAGAKSEWTVVRLGRLALRYWRERVEDFQEALGGLGAAPAFALRGAGPTPRETGAERLLKAEGKTADAWAKLTENADHATVGLVLWLEPKAGESERPFTVTVLGANRAPVTGPIECAARSVVRFASIAPGGEYALAFKTEAETWQIRWEIAPAA